MVETYCCLGIGGFLPLDGGWHDVEEDGAFEGEAGVCWCVDGETVGDSGAAVVAG